MYFIFTDCSIREHRSDFSTLCWHNVPVYYALNYTGIFNGGLTIAIATYLSCVALLTWPVTVTIFTSSSVKVANRDLCTPHTCEISCMPS